LCDGKVTIFEYGEEKHKLDTQNRNQTHVLWLITDVTLFTGIQTNCTYVHTDATEPTKR
jgi:hypothetical protein